ncbi:WD40-repeat-containing domain protein [Sporodiniella umbellata]|nr:WD40-repeat-containing domain protein [Sporodiniella umbellata]
MPQLSEYEQSRLENIKANQELLKSLELPFSTTSQVKSKKQKVQKRATPTRVNQPATRLSARLRGKAPESSPSLETIEALELKAKKRGITVREYTDLPNSEPTWTSPNVSLDATQALYDRLALDSSAKVTPYRINRCGFHPSGDLLGCAVDIEGHLGIWNIGSDKEAVQYRAHRSTISDLHFDKTDANKLLTSSYDGHVKQFDFQKETFETLTPVGNTEAIAAMDVQDGPRVWFSTLNGNIGCFDRRSNAPATVYEEGSKKLGCVHLNPVQPHLLAVASNDRKATVYDIRQMKVDRTVQTLAHGYAVTGCYWSPQGNVLATTSYDDRIRLFQWTGAELQLKSAIHHNLHTGRWVTNLRAGWNTNPHQGKEHQHFIIGNMNRTLDLFSGENGQELKQLSVMTTIQSVVQFHPTTVQPTVLSGNASGRMICWTVQ